MKASRSLYWDIAKGISIILVILGHVVPVGSLVRRIIFSYHMPFFFLANAYFIKNYDIFGNVIKSVKSLIKPYTIVCIISAILCVEQNTSAAPNYLVFCQRIADMIIGMSKTSTRFQSFGSVWLVWFVVCLFAARILYICLMSFLQKTHLLLQGAVMLFLCAIGSFIGHRFAFLPWSLDVSLVALPFMWFGDHLKQFQLSEHPKRFFICAICCLIIWIFLLSKGIQIEMATRYYPGHFLSILCAIAGSVTVLYISWISDRFHLPLNAFFSWCGRHSMVILALHCLEMRFVHWDSLIINKIPISLNCYGVFVIKLMFILLAASIIVFIKERIDALDQCS